MTTLKAEGWEYVAAVLTEEQQENLLTVARLIDRARKLGGKAELEDLSIALNISGSLAILKELEERAENAGGEVSFEASGPEGGTIQIVLSS